MSMKFKITIFGSSCSQNQCAMCLILIIVEKYVVYKHKYRKYDNNVKSFNTGLSDIKYIISSKIER